MKAVLVKTQSPKPNLRIRIPPPRSDEEILKSPTPTPVCPKPSYLHVQTWLRGSIMWNKI